MNLRAGSHQTPYLLVTWSWIPYPPTTVRNKYHKPSSLVFCYSSPNGIRQILLINTIIMIYHCWYWPYHLAQVSLIKNCYLQSLCPYCTLWKKAAIFMPWVRTGKNIPLPWGQSIYTNYFNNSKWEICLSQIFVCSKISFRSFGLIYSFYTLGNSQIQFYFAT